MIDDALRNDYLVPDADAREFYQQNLRFFTAPEQVRLRNIYFIAEPSNKGTCLIRRTR